MSRNHLRVPALSGGAAERTARRSTACYPGRSSFPRELQMVQRRIDTRSPEFFPAYVVWELTLKCDQPCTHCGSRAGDARPRELSTGEALVVVEQLAAQRAKEVVLIGGEAYLHPGFLEIVRAL